MLNAAEADTFRELNVQPLRVLQVPTSSTSNLYGRLVSNRSATRQIPYIIASMVIALFISILPGIVTFWTAQELEKQNLGKRMIMIGAAFTGLVATIIGCIYMDASYHPRFEPENRTYFRV